jgi:broad specificity phosphatase PhoE
MTMTLTDWRAGVLAIGLALLSAGIAAAQGAKPTTVIVVRHAEKAAAPADDPPLTELGEARARALLDAVRDAGVSAVITTQFTRTKATAQPTAMALGITPEIVATTGASHVQDVVAAIHKHAGQTVLVVGHSNTVPAIIGALGATAPPAICDAEYDNLYIVTIAGDGKASVVHAKFGARTPVGASCTAMR